MPRNLRDATDRSPFGLAVKSEWRLSAHPRRWCLCRRRSACPPTPAVQMRRRGTSLMAGPALKDSNRFFRGGGRIRVATIGCRTSRCLRVVSLRPYRISLIFSKNGSVACAEISRAASRSPRAAVRLPWRASDAHIARAEVLGTDRTGIEA